MAKKNTDNYKWYVLVLLTIMTTFAHLDRHLIVILQEAIKKDLSLSDTQLGLLTGAAFALSYTLMGIPVAQLADRYNRKKIISLALAFWSAVTAVTGFANSYLQIFLARVGVGLGETGSGPPAISMIADYFPTSERGKAYGIRGMGTAFGLLLGFSLGGLLEEQYGWRTAFWVVGTPGILFALLFYFTIREPIRGQLDQRTEETGKEKAPGMLAVFKYMLSKKTIIFMVLGASIHLTVGLGMGNWMPSFLARIHGMGTAEIGVWLALLSGVGGAIGVFSGGYLADKLSVRDIRWYFWVPMIAFIISAPFSIAMLFSENKMPTLLLFAIPATLSSFFLGPCIAMMQDMVEIKMRATASATFSILMALIGGAMGPLLVGSLSDYFEPTYGQEAIRNALFWLMFLEILAIWFFYQASRTLKEDLII